MKNLIVDYRISKEEEGSLKSLGYNILKCPPCKNLHISTEGHPDMLLHILNKETIVVHRDIDKSFIKTLYNLNKKIILSDTSIKTKYPLDIILNGVNLNDYFIHYTKYTDKKLLDFMSKNKKIINVKQGYTKCSTAIVSNNAIMTSDIGIAKAMEKENFDVLLLPPGDIILEGLDYGFIGGTCGLIDDNVLAFYGNLELYAYGREVLDFLKKHNVKPVFLSDTKLIDRGSIFFI